jgi:hypothetical protein
MSATLRRLEDDEYLLELQSAAGAQISARGTLAQISFETLLPLLPVAPGDAPATPTITIRRVDDDEYTAVSQGVLCLNLRSAIEPLAVGLCATVSLLQQLTHMIPTAAPSPPERSRLRKKAGGRLVRPPSPPVARRTTRSMTRSTPARRRAASEVAPLPPRNQRRKVIELESDEEASDDGEDDAYESDAGSFIVPDDEASDDGSDAEEPPVEASDDEQTMFARMRGSNMDERAAFCKYMKYLANDEPIPASETAVRRVADYPLQLANSIAKSGLWSDALVNELRTAAHIDDQPLSTSGEGVCQVCSRTRVVSREVTLFTRWGTVALPMSSYKCGATCARRLLAYRQLVVLRDRMCSVYDDGSDAALQHCWRLRRDAIAAAITFSKRDDDTD